MMSTHGFCDRSSPLTRPLQITSQKKPIPSQYSSSISIRRHALHMTNVTLPDEDGIPPQEQNPLATFFQFWDSFLTTSAYRTLLLTGALFSSKSIRDFLGIPGCLAILTSTFGLYFYDSRFNYLVDVVTPKRQKALRAIRQYKTQQLQIQSKYPPPTDGNDGATLQDLLDDYETILREELTTRVLIPPNLWVIEMDPTQEDRSTAPQFLGLKITDQYTLEPFSMNRTSNRSTKKDTE